MEQDIRTGRGERLAPAAEIVSAHVGNNGVDAAELDDFIGSVLPTLSDPAAEGRAPTAPTPAVPVKRSVTEDHVVRLEDGKKLKTLKRHLMTAHGMTPERCRAKRGLKAGSSLVAPGLRASGRGRRSRRRPDPSTRTIWLTPRRSRSNLNRPP